MRDVFRRTFLGLALLVPLLAAAQGWPNRPIRVLSGFNAGTTPDTVARLVGNEMSKQLGQPIAVEPRPGAAGHLALTAVSKSTPDGYTLVVSSAPTSSSPLFLSTDSLVGKDFTALGNASKNPVVLIARSSLGPKNWTEFVAHAKRNPGKINYAAISTQSDLILALIAKKVGIDYAPIPYKGAPFAQLLSGEVDFFGGTLLGVMGHVEAGKLNLLLAYSPGSMLPAGVPNALDLGLLPFPYDSYQGFYGPAGLPREMVQKFTQALLVATRTSEVTEGLRKIGQEAAYMTPEDQMRDYEAKIGLLAEAARLTGFKPQ
jgi:tripartite-type tricarboxylate transporter receptor subunit TctC